MKVENISSSLLEFKYSEFITCLVTSRVLKPNILFINVFFRLLRWSSGRECDCPTRGLRFDYQVGQTITEVFFSSSAVSGYVPIKSSPGLLKLFLIFIFDLARWLGNRLPHNKCSGFYIRTEPLFESGGHVYVNLYVCIRTYDTGENPSIGILTTFYQKMLLNF
ncbi:hypothetical protein SFRURICE_014941 [Spodoptera frugiperda]|nr:hypothetical protein SFRURICE_014941 [Spodoptera frugiperda]